MGTLFTGMAVREEGWIKLWAERALPRPLQEEG